MALQVVLEVVLGLLKSVLWISRMNEMREILLVSQLFPVYPAGQSQLPITWSQATPPGQMHLCSQFLPNHPDAQAIHKPYRQWEKADGSQSGPRSPMWTFQCVMEIEYSNLCDDMWIAAISAYKLLTINHHNHLHLTNYSQIKLSDWVFERETDVFMSIGLWVVKHMFVRACVCACVYVLAHSVGSWFLSTQVCTCTGHSPGHMTLRCGSHMIDCSWDQMYLLDKLEHKHIFESNF